RVAPAAVRVSPHVGGRCRREDSHRAWTRGQSSGAQRGGCRAESQALRRHALSARGRQRVHLRRAGVRLVPQQLVVEPLGIVTQPNKLGQIPAGGMREATNVAIRSPGVIENMRGWATKFTIPLTDANT